MATETTTAVEPTVFDNIKAGTAHLFNDLSNGDTDALLNDWVIPYLGNTMIAIVIFVVGKQLAKWFSRWTGKIAYRSSRDEMLKNFVESMSYFVFLLIVVIAALSQLGINTSSLVALLAAAGLAIGLALQNSLQNFAAGVMLLVFKPFRQGDYIETGGVSGTVQQMGILVLELRTPDNKTVLIPNGKVFSDSIINYSANDTRRVDFIFDISYDSDITEAKELIKACMAKDKRILADPAPLIGVGSLAASSVQIYVRPWVQTGDYWGVHYDLTENVKLAMDKAGIEIPFNQLSLQIPANEAEKLIS